MDLVLGTLAITVTIAILHNVGALHYLKCSGDIGESPEPSLASIYERRVDVGPEVRVEGEVRNILSARA